MDMEEVNYLEALLEQSVAEAAHWKAHARKWEERSKKNYRQIIRLENELLHHIKLLGELK